ncbi:hypothetical protein [Wenzhouxiangella sp. EGI_FJ10409]|uniref:hypothetical protein n=1 Tax=Wenzhouxiangella sp. EGI_FJ10409 TaxID=3243767 RepID=UPI0035D650CD
MKFSITFQSAILSVLFLAFYATADSPDFLVEMRIMESGTEVASPQIMIKEGAEGSLSTSGESGVALGLVVNEVSEQEVHVMAEVESGQSAMSPELLIRTGQWASVSSGDMEFHLRVEHLAAGE